MLQLNHRDSHLISGNVCEKECSKGKKHDDVGVHLESMSIW